MWMHRPKTSLINVDVIGNTGGAGSAFLLRIVLRFGEKKASGICKT